jgi:glutamate synthase domain-containing protein 1
LLREGQIRIPAGCALSGIMSRKGARFSGEEIIKSIALMHDRSNGLGGGFAAYGIYPQFKELYAFHLFYDNQDARTKTEEFINRFFYVESAGKLPTRRHPRITNAPVIWRYFVYPKDYKVRQYELSEEEYTAKGVIHVNSNIPGAFVFSSGKNMGAFKAVGYPEDVGEFYMLENYEAYLWTAHGRFPTNTPGWWGGAHPFTLLDLSTVHNGEISSYDANKRYIEMFGYKCTLMTDTEVITYLVDYLIRKQGLSLETAAEILAAPFWEEIDCMPEPEKKKFTALRTLYASALVNGPFSIIVGFSGGFMALNDRLKLRPLIAAEKDDRVYVASEESAIRAVCESPDRLWAPRGGEPVIVRLENNQ